MIDMRTQKPGVTPPEISIMQIDQDLKDGINKSDIAIKYGIKKWELDEVFKHPFLKGRKPSRKKMLSFKLVDDSPLAEDAVNPNQVTLEDAIDDAIESCEQAKDELKLAADEIEDILSPSEFETPAETLLKAVADTPNEDYNTAENYDDKDTDEYTADCDEEDELEMDDDTFEL